MVAFQPLNHNKQKCKTHVSQQQPWRGFGCNLNQVNSWGLAALGCRRHSLAHLLGMGRCNFHGRCQGLEEPQPGGPESASFQIVDWKKLVWVVWIAPFTYKNQGFNSRPPIKGYRKERIPSVQQQLRGPKTFPRAG